MYSIGIVVKYYNILLRKKYKVHIESYLKSVYINKVHYVSYGDEVMENEKFPKEVVSIAWILVLGAVLPMLDSTIVNIAVNDLANVFSASFTVTQWVVTGYVLALGIAVPFSGWLMQKYDGKGVYMGA